MASQTQTDWYIIINPRAGSGKTMSEWAVAQALLEDAGITYDSIFTQYMYHAKELAMQAAARGYRKFIAVGGDGSVHEVFSGLMEYSAANNVPSEDFYIGVIPIGSGNDWIKSLHVPHNLRRIIQIMKDGSFQLEDVVKVETSKGSSYMANIGGVGFDSNVCVMVNEQKKSGRRSKSIYVQALLRTIAHLNVNKLQIIADGVEVYNGPTYSIAIGNGIYSGGGMKQTAGAVIDDGLLDMLIVPKVSVPRIAKEIHGIFDGSIIHTKCLKYMRAKDIQIIPLDAKSADWVEIDGEIEGCIPLHVSITGHKIHAFKEVGHFAK